jgi:hypothetical protein
MRCLYCGKELALLKRWTGGGEFCSDVHRQRYQEEYNQLALNRLLQAKPPSEPVKPAEPVVAAPPAPEKPVQRTARISAPPEPSRIPETRVVSAPVALAPQEESAPAELAGYLVEMPIPVLAEVAPMAAPGLDFFQAAAAALPNHAFEPSGGRQVTFQLETAGPLTLQPSNRASNCTASGSRERRLEVREFVRTAPIVDIDLNPAGETGLETSSEAMDILFFPQPPHASPALWQEPPVGFSAGGTELGHLARLSFPTTGFSDEAEPEEPQPEEHQHAPPVAVAEPPAPEVYAEPEPPEPAPWIPEAVTKPLPLVLQVAAPGKAKTVQIFSASSTSVAVLVPRSTSLPLRPLMTFGPAPSTEAAKVPERAPAKAEPRKPAAAPTAVNPSTKPASTKTRPADLKPATTKAAVTETIRQPIPAPKPPAKKPEPVLPAPLAAPYPGSGDLGLPQLNLQSSRGFWGGLPIFAKIAIVVVMLAGVGGAIAYSAKSSPAAVTAHSGAGTLVTGAPLPASDGWITDWGADPGVRRTRQISVLRSSQTFTDYRIEMQGQIETKAIGWVFRAADPKNFYVAKLEIIKPGLEPTVALVRFAVINGEEQDHTQTPLPMKVRRDTMYKIRFDAVGNRFTTYVQDEKVDEWTNDQVKTGGVGLYSERGEVATLKGGMSVLPLVFKK